MTAIKSLFTAYLLTIAGCAAVIGAFHFVMGLWFFFALALGFAGACSWAVRMMWRKG